MGLEEYHVTASRHEASRYELMDSGYNLTPPYGRVASGQETGLFHVDRPGVAWDWMSQTGQAPNRSDWVRPQVAESWSRCIGDYGLTPGARLANGGTALDPDHPRASGILAQPDARATLANIAFSLHSLLRDTSVALLMADPAGTLIHVMEAGLVLRQAGRRLVALGSRWQETVLGNNGLGTAAVLRKPVAFDGKEHFAAELHPYATVGQLITGPQGEPVALLGLITDRHNSASSLLCFLRLAEHLVESNLFEQLGSGGYTLRLRPTGLGAGVAVEDCLLDGLISVCETGIISGATRAALALLGSAEHRRIAWRAIGKCAGASPGARPGGTGPRQHWRRGRHSGRPRSYRATHRWPAPYPGWYPPPPVPVPLAAGGTPRSVARCNPLPLATGNGAIRCSKRRCRRRLVRKSRKSAF